MRTIIKAFMVAACCLLTISCKETTKKLSSSGKAGEVIVVIDKEDWEGPVGVMLRDTLESDCPFLPQREPLYTLVNITPSSFNNFFQVHRNIIMVNIDDTAVPGITTHYNVWAAPQCVINIDALDLKTAKKMVSENKGLIVNTLEQAERDRVIRNAKKYEEVELAPVVRAMAGGSPHFPVGYALKKKTNDFIWITSDTQFTQQGIFVYKYPHHNDPDAMTCESIIRHRNEIMKNNVPGMFENTYMTTSSFGKPSIEYVKYQGRHFAQVRGLWEVENDFMGGPFVSHSFYRPDGKDIIVLEGFVYAPKYDKREYLRQVEAILYSFEWENSAEKE